MVIGRLLGRAGRTRSVADKLLGPTVAQARRPEFYTGLGVADTLDGRFDMIVVHLILVLRRLKAHRDLAQAIFDGFFADMDQSLREMGVGDLTVPKKIKAMTQAFYGRVEAYSPAVDAGDADALALAVERNVFRTEAEAPSEAARQIAAYMLSLRDSLDAQSDETLFRGEIRFADIPAG